jgi:AraC family transcriptional activator of pobA
LETLKDKKWHAELKVLYLADYKKIKSYDAFFSPDWFSLVAVVAGSVQFTGSSYSVSLSSGDILSVPHGASLVRLSSPLRICLISCTMDFAISNKIARLGSACIESLASQSPFVLPLSPTEMKHMVSLFALLKKKISNKEQIFQEELVLLCVNLILYEYCGLYYKYGQHIGAVQFRNDKTVTNFITLVQRHCKKHRETKFYADSLFVSQGHLRKTVRGAIGISAKHFIEMTVISEAYLLLSDDKLSIAEVAECLNFKDSSSFSHFFKRHSKLSPTQYRLNHKP